ncbi:MAG: vWA domain-containing protein [Planctomycetota bacterium]
MPATPDWRTGNQQPTGGGSSGGGWSQQSGRGVWTHTATRTVSLLLLAGTLAGLLFYWGDLIRRDKPPAPLLVLAPSGYRAPAPPNALVAEDVDQFVSTFDGYRNVRVEKPDGDIATSEGFLLTLGDFLRNHRPSETHPRPAIIYLNAIGLVNRKGEPCLLLPDHAPLDDSSWLPWSKVVEKVRETRQRDAAVLLLLDAQHLDTDWSLGVIQNGFTPLVREQLANEDDPRLLVIAAASGLQTRLAHPATACSPFAHYASAGLRGGADEDNDSAIAASELAAYLRREVNAWALRHAGRAQTPALMGRKDVDLLVAEVADFVDPPALRSGRESTDNSAPANDPLAEYWAALKELSGQRLVRPLEFARVTRTLRRLDSELLAGRAYQPRIPNAFGDLRSDLDTLRQGQRYEPTPCVGSLHQRRLWPGSNASKGPTTSELRDAYAAWVKKPDEVTQFPAYADRLTAVWAELLQEPFDAELAAATTSYLDRPIGDRPAIDFYEATLLRVVAAHADLDNDDVAARAQQLFAATDRAEPAATPPRPAVAPMLAPLHRELDAAFGRALDLLLIADRASLADFDETLRQITNRSRTVQELTADVVAAADMRDDSLAFAMFAGEWAQRLASIEPTRKARELFEKRVGELLDDSEALGAALRNRPMDADRSAWESFRKELVTATQSVSSSLRTLRQAYRERVGKLAAQEQGSLVATRPLRETLLAHPLKIDSGWMGLRSMHLTAAGESDADAIDQRAAEDHLEWLAGSRHPLERVLKLPVRPAFQADSDAARLRRLSSLGGDVRDAIAACGAEIEKQRQATTNRLSKPGLIGARVPLAQADAALRSLIVIAGGRLGAVGKSNAFAELRRFDTHAWSLRQAEQTTRSMWRSDPKEDAAWFYEAAMDRVRAAEGAFPAAGSVATAERRRQAQDVAKRLADWRPLLSNDVFLPDGKTRVVTPLSAQGLGTNNTDATAAVEVRLPSGVRVPFDNETSRVRLPVIGTDSLELDVASPTITKAGGLGVYTVLRGHMYTARVALRRGDTVVYKKPRRPPATVKVSGNQSTTTNLYFIVDCSRTMNPKVGPGDLGKAGDALIATLDDLKSQGGENRAALFFYGRRAALKGGKAPKVAHLRNTDFQGHPGDDVELAIPLTSLNQFFPEAKRKLSDAQPYGLTPLYNAIVEAIEEAASRGVADDRRRVVVLTDGLDNPGKSLSYPVLDTLGEPRRVTRIRSTKSFEIVRRLERLGGNRPRVDILLFDGRAPEARDENSRQGVRELREIATASGGSVVEAGADGDAGVWLEDQLREALGVENFVVEPIENDDRQPVEAPLGGVAELAAGPGRYRVRLVKSGLETPIEVEGGEAFRFEGRGGRLISATHSKERGNQDVGPYRVFSHVPESRGDAGVVYQFSMTDPDDASVPPRPAVVWAKLSLPRRAGSGEDGRRPKYFLDRFFASKTPVPVLELWAEGWPNRTTKAEIHFAMTAPKGKLFEVGRPGAVGVHPVVDATLNVVSRLTENDGLEVEVRVTHDEDTDYPLHVSTAPEADRVARSFSEATREAVHTFGYELDPRDVTVRVLTPDQISQSETGGRVEFEVSPAR